MGRFLFPVEPFPTALRPGGMLTRDVRRLTVVGLVAAIVVGGCLGISGGATFEGREFLSIRVTEDGADRPLVPDTRIRLRFADGQLSAQAGCNSFGAAYEVRDGRLVVDGGAMTEMGCDDPRHAQDDWLFAFLGSQPAIGGTGAELVLSSGPTTIALLDREVAQPDVALVGPVWSVDAIITGDAVASLPAGAKATLQFSQNGQVSIFAGCNQGGARVEIAGDRMRFIDVVTTDMGCAGDAGRLESDVLRVLGTGELQWQIDADRLQLLAPGTGLTLVAGS